MKIPSSQDVWGGFDFGGVGKLICSTGLEDKYDSRGRQSTRRTGFQNKF
jgi:hypothetical protein